MSYLTSSVALALGVILALPAGSVLAIDKAAERKAEAKEQKAKADQNRLPKDRKPRPKAEVAKGIKAETQACTKIEADIKVQVTVLNDKADDPEADAFCDKLEAEFAEVIEALDALEAHADELDEEEIEAVIDALVEDVDDFEELADELEELADEEDDEDLYAVVDAIDDLVFVLELTIEHLDDLADELDGTIGDDVDIVIVIEID
jgi:hypothetical protein